MQGLARDLRHGDEILLPHVVDRFEQHVADDRRLPAGLDVHAFDLLERLLPVVAESHLRATPCCISCVAPREFLLGERDELLWRVRDHFVREILDQPRAPSGGARDARAVGLARRVRIERHVGAGHVSLAGVLDEQVVDLRVAAQTIEVERLQRGEPVDVVLLRMARPRVVGRGTASGGISPAASRGGICTTGGGRRDEPLYDRRHLVLRKPHQRFEIRDLGDRGRRRGGNRRCRRPWSRGTGRHCELPEEDGVPLERRIQLLERHAHPPREDRVVAVREVEPGGHAVAKAVHRIGSPRRDLLRQAWHRARLFLETCAHLGDLPRDGRQLTGCLSRVHVLETNPRLRQIDEGGRKRHQRRELGDRRGIGIELRQVGGDGGVETCEVSPRRRRQLRRVELREGRLPIHVEPFQARDAPHREPRRLRPRSCRAPPLTALASASPSASARPAGVEVSVERRAIGVVQEGDKPHFALRGRQQRLEVRRHAEIRRRRLACRLLRPDGRDTQAGEHQHSPQPASTSGHRVSSD